MLPHLAYLTSSRQTVEALEKEKNEVAQMLRNTTKDYLEMRKQCEVQRRNHLEEMETLVKLNQTLQEAVKRLEGRVAAEATAVRESLQKENKVFNEQAKRRVRLTFFIVKLTVRFKDLRARKAIRVPTKQACVAL